ncbi:MAG: AMP-binding protein [Candidatus Rokubacteria bacterium]|nr:AMP-binding protein [Candidatus Rokubacteria bacterium]
MAPWVTQPRVGDLPDQAAGRFGPWEALCFEDRRWNFIEFRVDVDRAARALMALGVSPGEHIALWLPNRPEWLHLFYAVAKIGAVVVPVNTRFRTRDLGYVLHQSDATTLITTDRAGSVGYLDMVRDLCPELDAGTPAGFRSARFPALRRIVAVGETGAPGVVPWTEALRAGDRVPEAELRSREAGVDPRGTVLIMYTSGTTGFPKGAMHSHCIVQTVADGASRWGITPREVILMYLPLFHTFGLYEGVLMSLVSGARIVLMERFDPGEALHLLARERATYLCGFDTHFHDLMEHPAFPATDRRGLRLGFLPAGLASTEPIARRANRAFVKTVSAYGMTEIGTGACRSFLDASEDERCLGSGYPAPGYEYKVVDPATGHWLAPGVPGELCVRGYAVMQGYYRKPEETAQVVDAEAWFHTGDMAVIDRDGFVRFMGRYKEMLKVGGENVDPAEVEALLVEHPAVSLAKVVGVPDPRLGEVSVACLVLREGHRVTEEEMLGFCRGKLASFKLPKRVLFFDDYPMTTSGKVQKFQLREMALARLARQAIERGSPAASA